MSDANAGMIYQLDDKPPVGRWILYGLQHIVVAFAAMVGVPLALSGAIGLSPQETTVLVSGVLVSGGVLCLLQSLGAGPVGARLPLMNLATFKFLGPMIMGYNLGGFSVLFGATILGGFVEVILAQFAATLKKLFSPFLVGAFLLIIGVSLLPIGIRNFFAIGNPMSGTPAALVSAFLSLALIAFFGSLRHRMIRPVSVLAGIAGGYIIAALLGLVNWQPVINARWIGFHAPFQLGVPTWPGFSVLIAISVVYLVSFIETVADTTAVASITGSEVTAKQLRGSLMADGLSGPIGAFFNAVPMTTFGQNIGLIKLTGIGSRYVVAMAGGILVLMGLVPKLAAIISVMPPPVLGAALVMTFGMIASEGIRRLASEMETPRNAIVASLGLAAALSVWVLPQDMIQSLPGGLRPFLSDSMVAGLLVCMVSDWLVPRNKNRSTNGA